MRIRLTRILLAGAATIATAGCSTIITGTSEEVSVETPGVSGATCSLTGGDGLNASVIAPGKVRVLKSKLDIKVTCTAAGAKSASRIFASSYSDY